jgi:hypothetical protein
MKEKKEQLLNENSKIGALRLERHGSRSRTRCMQRVAAVEPRPDGFLGYGS